MNIFIALAHNYDSFPKKFVFDLIAMQAYFNNWVRRENLDHNLVVSVNGGYNLDKMRCEVTENCLEQGADYILYLDTDMSFPEDTIVRLFQVLERNKEYAAVSGIYTAKKVPYLPHIFSEFNNKKKKFFRVMAFPVNVPFPIEGCGAGILMVDTKVFKKIDKPYFKFVDEGEMKELPFGCGEDLYFCWKLRKAKFKMLCDPAVQCGHYDTRPVSLSNYLKHNNLKMDDKRVYCTKRDLIRIEKQLRAKKAR